MIEIRGDVDPRAVEQLVTCVEAGDSIGGALCADGHVGYSMPIGGVVAYREQISPSGVGYDIGCGNKAVLTDLRTEDVDVGKAMDEIVRRVSFGMGRSNDEPVDDAVLDRIRTADFEPQRKMYDLAARQLGTVGAGNHYVDLFDDEQGRLWVGVHFGSRGFGHKTCTGFIALSQGKLFDQQPRGEEMFGPPILFSTNDWIGQAYIAAMQLAGDYAYAGRDAVCRTVLDVLGAREVESVHNHHNFAWLEEHVGEQVWVVRKGATPAFPGQRGFVGATMGETSVILEGADDVTLAGADLFWSTVHGAGRVMSRTQAAGKMANVYECNVRDCTFSLSAGQYRDLARKAGKEGSRYFSVCPTHGDREGYAGPGVGMRKLRKRVKEGAINFDAVRYQMRTELGIELRGAAADEAPGAYKRLDEVLAAMGPTINVLHRLRPVGVAMAGPDIYDPFKD